MFIKIRKLFGIAILGLLCFNKAKGQTPTNQDCLGALPVCQNLYSETRSPSGEGNYTNEINTNTSCLTDGETNSIWYTFTVNKTGNFGFLITPNDLKDDYDWSLYNITRVSCADIFSNRDLIVSCNATGDTACHGPTGATGGSNSNFQGYGCEGSNSPENALVPVQAGNTYVLLINNWTGSVNGYTLDFGLSDDIGIVDIINPEVVEITTNRNDSFTVQFSENIQCESIAPENFEIMGTTESYEIILTEGSCTVGARYAQQFTYSISPPLANGDYIIEMKPNENFPVVDVCDNPAMPAEFNWLINFCEYTTTINCDDGRNCTNNDVAVVDRMENSVVCVPCAGEPSGGCGVGESNILPCDDGDPLTENDVEIILACDETVCEPCLGTPICNDLIVLPIAICPGDSALINDGTYIKTAGEYIFTFTNQAGCDSTIVDQITVSPEVSIVAADTVYTTINEPTLLEVTTNANDPVYLWSPPNNLSCSNCAEPMFNTNQTGIQMYAINIVDNETGCTASQTFMIKVSLPNDIFIPNAFSPNQDGQNDELIIRFQGNIVDVEVAVFNRWGNSVYLGNLGSPFWDGYHQNEKLPIGVYPFYVVATYVNNQQVIKKGNVTLIR